jgi:uncharacterized paraquat-inducible protein A
MKEQAYWCPECDELIEVSVEAKRAQCPGCRNLFDLDRDAEFTDGSWKDLTTLTLVKQDLA